MAVALVRLHHQTVVVSPPVGSPVGSSLPRNQMSRRSPDRASPCCSPRGINCSTRVARQDTPYIRWANTRTTGHAFPYAVERPHRAEVRWQQSQSVGGLAEGVDPRMDRPQYRLQLLNNRAVERWSLAGRTRTRHRSDGVHRSWSREGARSGEDRRHSQHQHPSDSSCMGGTYAMSARHR
jgi:hypothetical protein